jgi:hypothetical protein
MGEDQRMLERLSRVLAPPPAQPSENEMRTWLRAVARVRRGWTLGHQARESSRLAPDQGVVHLPPVILHGLSAAAPGERSTVDSRPVGRSMRLLP